MLHLKAAARDTSCYAASVDPTDFCMLDIETAGGTWASFPEGFDLLMAGVSYRGEPLAYTAEQESLARLADFLDGFAGVVVTYNGASFDLPVLQRWYARELDRELRVAHHYDLLREIAAGRRISLDDLCHNTFGERKVPWDHRQNRRVWEQEPHRLIEYNKVDLELTAELYRRVLAGQPLFLGDTTVVLPLPGSSPATQTPQ